MFLRNEQTDVRTYDDELFFDAKKKQNLMSHKWRDEKLSPFNDYF